MRTIIQISTTASDDKYSVVALCSDDTVWAINDQSARWLQLPLIPQNTESPKEKQE